MTGYNVYSQIQQRRESCIQECFVIDSICHKALAAPEIFSAEKERMREWFAAQKRSALVWCEFDEKRLLNSLSGLIPGKDPLPPDDGEYELLARRAAANAPKFSDKNHEFSDLLSLIWMMCGLSVSAALAGNRADLSLLLQRFVTALRKVKAEPDQPPPTGGGVTTTAKGLKPPKPKPPRA